MVVGSSAQQPADAVQRVAGAAAVAGLLVLDTTADRVDGGEAESGDVEGIQHAHRVAEHGAQGGGVAAVGIQCGDADAVPPGRVAVVDPADQG